MTLNGKFPEKEACPRFLVFPQIWVGRQKNERFSLPARTIKIDRNLLAELMGASAMRRQTNPLSAFLKQMQSAPLA
jgi:hypothetical protein